MKRLGVFTLFLLLMVVPAAATPASQVALDELTALAAYFPDDTAVFLAARADDAYIATLDALLERVGEATAGAAAPPEGWLRQSLNQAAEAFSDGEGNFDTVFRRWAGDTVAVAVPSALSLLSGGTVNTIVAIEVTDIEEAEIFLDNLTEFDEYEKETQGDAILYEAQSDFGSHYLLRDEVMFIAPGGQQARSLRLRFNESLAESDEFDTGLVSLPEDTYNIVLYVNVAQILTPIAVFLPLALGEALPADFDLMPVVEALGPFVIGFTILDETSLVMDVALVVNDPAPFEAAGFLLGSRPALNVDFAGYVPADSILVIHDQDWGGGIIGVIDALRITGELLAAQGMSPFLSGERIPPRTRAEEDLLREININDFAAFLRLSFEGLTGLTLEEGLGWLSADYAAYLQVLSLGDDAVTVDAGVVGAVTDADRAFNLFVGLQDALDQLSLQYSIERGNLVLPQLRNVLRDLTGEDLEEVDLVIGLSDDVFVIGTRPGARHATDPEDGGLAETEAFRTARAYFLPDTHSLWYINLEPLAPLISEADANPRDIEMVLSVLDLLDSASMTAVSDDSGTGVVRFVLTVAE